MQAYLGNWSGSLTFTIYGDNNLPTLSQAQTYINSVQGQYWFLNLIGSEETYGMIACSLANGYHQFDSIGRPCWGAPNGFGLMQIDPPTGTSQPVRGVLWNWKTNIAAAIEELNTKAVEGNPFWSRQLQQWQQWNADADRANQPEKKVDVPVGPDTQIQAKCPFGLNLDGTVPAGSRSWADAILIKMYNSAPHHYISWDDRDPLNQKWLFNQTNGNGFDYVHKVCTQ